MPALLQISVNFSSLLYPLQKSHKDSNFNLKFQQPISFYSNSRTKIESFHKDKFIAEALGKNLPSLGVGRGKDGILVSRSTRRVVVVKFNNGFNGLGGGGGEGGGGGGRINGETARVLGNLGLAIVLTYLTMNGQLGWLLDAIVSLWVFLFFFYILYTCLDYLF